jgi:hypothetical protein
MMSMNYFQPQHNSWANQNKLFMPRNFPFFKKVPGKQIFEICLLRNFGFCLSRNYWKLPGRNNAQELSCFKDNFFFKVTSLPIQNSKILCSWVVFIFYHFLISLCDKIKQPIRRPHNNENLFWFWEK